MLASARALVLAAVTLTLAPAVASAADPASGKIGPGMTTTSWKGESQGFPGLIANDISDAATGPIPCVSAGSGCDSFDLDFTGDGTPLVIGVTSQTLMRIEVVKPDGTTVVHNDTEAKPGKPSTLTISAAKSGKYQVHVYVDSVVVTDGTYKGVAALGALPQEPDTDPGADTTGAGDPAPSGAPQQGSTAPTAQTQTPVITIATRTAKAKRRARALKLSISSSAPVTAVTVTLAKGKKKLATTKLSSLSARRTVKLRPKKALRRGTYKVAVVAKAADGTAVATIGKLRVK